MDEAPQRCPRSLGVITPNSSLPAASLVTRLSGALGLLFLVGFFYSNLASAAPSIDDNCAVKADGTLLCWGRGIYGRNGDGAYQDRFAPVRVGAFGEWKQVSGEVHVNCAVKKEGTMWCWGRNDQYQLGNGNTQYRNRPQQVGTGSDWKQASATGGYVCGVKTTGLAQCWGGGRSGRLGDGKGFNQVRPSDVIGNGWREIQTGTDFACGFKNDNTLWCWGDNGKGQFGRGNTTGGGAFPAQVDATGRWASISLGADHGCGIQQSDASLWCWGANYAGEIGDGTVSEPARVFNDGFPPVKATPVAVASGSRWIEVKAHGRKTCGIKEDGTLWCWGLNDRRQSGPGTSDADVLAPQLVSADTDWQTLGGNCGLKGTDTLQCWGFNDDGSLGIGVDPFIADPVQIAPITPWDNLSAGDHATCGVRSGELWCWGDGLLGRMGDGHHRGHQSPERIGTDSNWQSVKVGLTHACGVKTDKTIWCWGGGLDGQLGDNGNWYRPAPRRIDGTQQLFKQLDASHRHNCAIADNGSLWCWGDNTSRQSSSTLSNQIRQATQVNGDLDWQQIAAGTNHSCAIKTDNSLWCWGSNTYGQLGQGTEGGSNGTPTRVGSANNWRHVASGFWGSCATKTDNSLWCWGELDRYHLLNMQWSSPTRVLESIEWSKAVVDLGGLCGIATDGRAWCWGRIRVTVDHVNDVIYAEPRRMSDTLQFTDLSVTNHHVVGVTNTSEGWCWHELSNNACGQGNNAATPVGTTDTDAPEITVTDGPRQPDDSAADANFSFHANEDAQFECRLDNGPWEICTSPTTFSGVPRGARHVEIRATDLSGNTSAIVTYDWNASDAAGAPTTTITSGPTNPAARDAEFFFEADQNDATFKCRLQQAGQWTAWVDCESPVIYADLADGNYRFEVYGISDSGAVEPTIQSWEWSVYNAPISTWADHSCIVKTDNTLWCWGANSHGQLGLGDRNDRNEPNQIGNAVNWAVVSTGRRHSCAVNLDGQLYCWGDNRSNQLGLGSSAAPMISTPTQVAGDLWRDVAVGAAHSCALQGHNQANNQNNNQTGNQQTLWCWGNNHSGQIGVNDRQARAVPTQVTAAGDGWQRLVSGANHACGVINNSLYCWGDNVHGQLASGDQVSAVEPTLVAALDGNTTGAQFLSLHAGQHHNCAVTQNNGQRLAQCWGDNRSGQVGPGSSATAENQPVTVAPPSDGSGDPQNSDWLALFAGAEHTCGLRPGGELRCWGRNERGQLGLGHNDDQRNTDQALADPTWQSLDGGDAHSCAMRTDGSLHCWGDLLSGQLGIGHDQSTLPAIPPEAVSGNRLWNTQAGQLSGGGGHLCAITQAGNVACWGEGDTGQLGDSGSRDRLQPVDVNDGDAVGVWEQVSVGRRHSCGIKVTSANGNPQSQVSELYCWGDASTGRLGLPNVDRHQHSPARLTPPEPYLVGLSLYRVVEWQAIAVGGAHSCAVGRAVEDTGLQPERFPLYCWGNNRHGQLGTGDTATEQAEPVRVGADDNWKTITSGERHSCATHTDNSLWCWGNNERGQLADSSNVLQRQPKQVGTATHWQTVTAAVDSSCALTNGQQLFCAGANDSGELGLGHYRDVNELTVVSGSWQTMAQGDRYACAIQNNNRVYCWGSNHSGQLGIAGPHSATPVLINVPDGSNSFSLLTASESTACALASSGTLWCWGQNFSGQAGSDRSWRQHAQAVGAP